MFRAVKLLKKNINDFLDTLILLVCVFIGKINKCRGDLADIATKKASMVTCPLAFPGLKSVISLQRQWLGWDTSNNLITNDH